MNFIGEIMGQINFLVELAICIAGQCVVVIPNL
jgi:hypothetical protein